MVFLSIFLYSTRMCWYLWQMTMTRIFVINCVMTKWHDKLPPTGVNMCHVSDCGLDRYRWRQASPPCSPVTTPTCAFVTWWSDSPSPMRQSVSWARLIHSPLMKSETSRFYAISLTRLIASNCNWPTNQMIPRADLCVCKISRFPRA